MCYSQFTGGIKAGALLSKFKFENEDFEESGIKPSFFVSGFAEYKIGKIAPEIELAYNRSGNKGTIDLRENPDDLRGEYKSTYEVDVLTIALSAKYYPVESLALKFGFYTAPILSVNNTVFGFPDGERNMETDLSDSWQKTDNGIILGVSYFVSKNVFLDGTYLNGFTDIRGYQGEVKNRMVRLGLGYKF